MGSAETVSGLAVERSVFARFRLKTSTVNWFNQLPFVNKFLYLISSAMGLIENVIIARLSVRNILIGHLEQRFRCKIECVRT